MFVCVFVRDPIIAIQLSELQGNCFLFEMADVDIMHTVTEVKKTRKVKKSTTTSSKRRESTDQDIEVQITEIEPTTIESDKGYVLHLAIENAMAKLKSKRQDFSESNSEVTFLGLCECNIMFLVAWKTAREWVLSLGLLQFPSYKMQCVPLV